MSVRKGTFKIENLHNCTSAMHGRKNTAFLAVLLIAVSLLTYSFHHSMEVETFPHQHHHHNPKHATGFALSPPPSPPPPPPPPPPPLGGGVPLRVMFLGASVTRGDVSIGNLGFRAPLRSRLAGRGNAVNFVGTQRVGAFADNDVEARPGQRIDQLQAGGGEVEAAARVWRPNVFVVHAGANDCLQRHDPAGAGSRLRGLVMSLLRASPRAVVVLSTLLTNTVPGREACVVDVNAQVRRLASALQREGRPVVLAEMHYEQGLPDRPLPADISPDGTHPFDRGYRLMADVFYDAFLEADRRGLLSAPEPVDGVPDDGELERAGEPLVLDSDPPKKKKEKTRPALPAGNGDGGGGGGGSAGAAPPEKQTGDKEVRPKTAPEIIPKTS